MNLYRNPWLIALALIVLLVAVAGTAHAGEEQRQDAAGRDYWVYTPDQIDPDKTYWLVLGVHGYRGNGRGAGGMRGWAQEHDCIVVGPWYDSNGYQYLEKGADQQTLDVIATLRQEFKLQEKIFVAGFSGGAQFAHRFAMKYPDLVAGCAAHSGGTWGTGDYDEAVPNPAAKGVIFVISCGEKDTGKSFDEAPMGRLEWAQKYDKLLEEGGYVYDAAWIADTGHQYSPQARQMTADCFTAVTQTLPEGRELTKQVQVLIRADKYAEAWALIRAQHAEALGAEGILAKLYAQLLVDLEDDTERIDRWAAREVERAKREQRRDTDAANTKLDGLRRDFGDLPQTRAALGEYDDRPPDTPE